MMNVAARILTKKGVQAPRHETEENSLLGLSFLLFLVVKVFKCA
jgi:hypothetical protein